MLSIALFTYSVKARGSVVHAACLAEALAAEGADVTLYALAKPGDVFFRPLACRLVMLPAGPARAPAGSDRLIEQRIDEFQTGLAKLGARHHVYHAEDCLTASALLGHGRAGQRPLVRTVHHVERFESAYLASCQRRSIELADAVLSVSAFTAREVQREFGRASRVVHNGVDVERFAAPAEPRGPGSVPETLRSLTLREHELVVLSVGGVEPRKNTLGALEAVLEAAGRHPRLRWLVAGGASIWDHSELERRFDARVQALPAELRRRITRLGPVDEATLTWLYRRSDVLLAPSLHEGWGLSVLEGMAARSAVVCSEREPFTEFADGTTALLVDPESKSAIVTALDELSRDSALRSRLAAGAARRARDFSWRRAALAHLELYRSLHRPAERARGVPALPVA